MVPDSICHHHVYNGHNQAIRDKSLNSLKDPLEAFAVAGGLNGELIPYLTFHSNEHARLKCGIDGKFAGYKW